jgi:hypothetical protein
MGHPRDIVKLLHDLLADGEKLAGGFRQVAEINDAFVAGSQYGGITYRNSQTVVSKDEWFDDEDVPRIHVNVLGNLVATLVSLLTKNRPCAVARPLREDDPQGAYRAEVSNGVIRYLSQELKTVEVIQQALKLAETHGSGGIKVWFDKESNQAAIAPVSIFNVTLDASADNAADSTTFIFHRWLPLKKAEAEMKRAGMKRSPRVTEYDTASGIKKRGVKAHEMWVMPGANEGHPQGLYAFVVDDVVVEQTAYPLMIETEAGQEALPPLVWITARTVEECVYGRTAVTDCIPLQRTLNETVSRSIKYLRLDSSPKLLHPDGLAEGVDPYADAKIPFPMTDNGIAAMREMKWMKGPGMPPELPQLIEWLIKQIHDIIGVAPLTAGTQTRNVSGKALEEVEGLDQQKNSQTTRSLETAVLELYRILLAIVQTFYDDNRQLAIVGGSRAEVLLFRKADVMGKDIRLEPASEFDLMQPVQEQQALERADQGLGTLGDARGAARDPRHAFSRQLAERLVKQALAGETIEVAADDIDADAFKAVIAKHKHLAVLEGRQSDYATLVDLERFVDELGLEAEQANPQPEPAAAPLPGEPPPSTPPPEGVLP